MYGFYYMVLIINKCFLFQVMNNKGKLEADNKSPFTRLCSAWKFDKFKDINSYESTK